MLARLTGTENDKLRHHLADAIAKYIIQLNSINCKRMSLLVIFEGAVPGVIIVLGLVRTTQLHHWLNI